MNVEIKIENKTVEISLLNKRTVLDKIVMVEEHRLSEDLLPMIDELLKKNNLIVGDVDKMILKSDMEDNFTTQRIAKAVVQAFNWTKKLDKR